MLGHRLQAIAVLQHLGSYLLDLLFPPHCVGCQRPGHWFCHACAQDVRPVPQPVCQYCGSSLGVDIAEHGQICRRCRQVVAHPLRLVRAATLHTGPMRLAIHALKYEGRVELAQSLARYLHAVVLEEAPWPAIMEGLDGIVPVPLHAERMSERGYNQAWLLADSFAGSVAIPILDEVLVRVKGTRSQVGLSAQDRSENVQGAFQAVPEQVQKKTVLLVDDVYTTGATMTACAVALRQAGARDVFGLALARPDQHEQM